MVRRRDHTSGGDALAPTGERSPTRAIAPRAGVGQGGVLSGRPETPAFVRSVASLMTLGCGTISIYTSDTRGALVDGRSRARGRVLLWIETLCQCISDALRIMRDFRDNTVCRMSDRPHVVARSLGQSTEIRLAPIRPCHDNDASSAMVRLPGAYPLAQCGPEVLYHIGVTAHWRRRGGGGKRRGTLSVDLAV